MAEGVGFEPTELSLNGFQDRRLKPLGHPSTEIFRLITISSFQRQPFIPERFRRGPGDRRPLQTFLRSDAAQTEIRRCFACGFHRMPAFLLAMGWRYLADTPNDG